ncbi:bifunctional methionine sulfoxide reductase B/A protein [Halosquirtibacter xylanolyticus]|uniref:bifunctional methionine sulfoxide reductase B/A protein n=1 Tax=Halosquirtibacter xylanolyticus TaxID=3374599 RepID=UPI003748F1C4|nr:bifunctional methionine sulfoxide reductase B/A protein [Prolixibacteraceae bacterium]
MRKILYILILFTMTTYSSEAQNRYNSLNTQEENVIENKHTEAPFTGQYDKFNENGTYICKRCNAPLYQSSDKFDSGCGWPAFDDEIEGAVKRIPDNDGLRTEIVCANCGGHLGHVFLGEGFTSTNTRHCVNSISMTFVPKGEPLPKIIAPHNDTEVAYLASGCFWGTEYHLQKIPGVISTTVGYMGGKTKNPTYREVCTGNTGHAETTKVVFDPSKVSFETIAKVYFETHDTSQIDGQGPDIGTQYRSVVFYTSDRQKATTEKLVKELEKNGYTVVTEVIPEETFYDAEAYHQDYYENKGSSPYCHIYQKKF